MEARQKAARLQGVRGSRHLRSQPMEARLSKSVRRKPKARMGTKSMARIARRAAGAVFNSQVETKKSSHTLISDTMFHNSINIIDSSTLKSSPGIYDPETIDISNRVGDEVTVQKIVFKGMLEMPP